MIEHREARLVADTTSVKPGHPFTAAVQLTIAPGWHVYWENPGDTALPIQVVSARPDWVEIVAPCSLKVADRIQSFMMRLEADLPEAVRESEKEAELDPTTERDPGEGKPAA